MTEKDTRENGLTDKADEAKAKIERFRRLQGSLVRLVDVVESGESAQDCTCERGFCGCTIELNKK